MWVEGRTSKQISETLGDVTRNAVMGMVNRMGLMGNKDHNARIKSPSGACRPIGLEQPVDDTKIIVEPASEPRHDPVPQPAPRSRIIAQTPPAVDRPRPGPASRPVDISPPVAVPAPAIADEARTYEQARLQDPAPKRQKLASRVLAPLRGPIVPEKTSDAPAPTYVQPTSERAKAPERRRADWRTAVSMVEELTGRSYSPAAQGHRTSLVAIASMLGGGDPRSVLPHDFPEPLVIGTMRSLAEKGIMVAGSPPETWFDPDLGDLNFFIDMLVAEGVMKGSRTSSSPTNLHA